MWIGVVVDAVLAGILLFITRGLDATYVYAPPSFLGNVPPPHWMSVVHTVWVVAAWAVISARRIWPRTVTIALPVLLAVHLAVLPTGYAAFVVTAFAMYHLGRYAPRRWFVPVWVAVVAGTVAALMLKGDYLVVDPVIGLFLSPVSFAVLGFFWMLGLNGRRRDRELMALRDRAELAAIAERTRIAREMHDIVAHTLSVVIAQADGGRYAAKSNPEAAERALTVIADMSRAALGDIRSIIGILRDPADASAPLAPEPIDSDLNALIDQVRESGQEVSYVVTGKARPLPVGVGNSLYRICQEALTNSLKHAGPHAQLTIALHWRPAEVILTVTDNGRGAAAVDDGKGHGLIGMNERAAVFGGTVVAGPRQGGGFKVTATIPTPTERTSHV